MVDSSLINNFYPTSTAVAVTPIHDGLIWNKMPAKHTTVSELENSLRASTAATKVKKKHFPQSLCANPAYLLDPKE